MRGTPAVPGGAGARARGRPGGALTAPARAVDALKEERRRNPPTAPPAPSAAPQGGNQKAKRSRDRGDRKLEKAEAALAGANRDVVLVRFKSTVIVRRRCAGPPCAFR